MLAWVVIHRRHLRHSTPISSSLCAQRLYVKLSDSFPTSFSFTSSISFTSFVSHLPYTLPSSVSRNPFVCHSCEKCRVSLALSSLLPLFAQRVIHNSFPFKRLRTLSKNSRVYPNSSHSETPLGTHASASHESSISLSLLPLLCELCVPRALCAKSFFLFQLSTVDYRPPHPGAANWLSSIPSAKIASLPTLDRQMARAIEESL